MLPSAALIAWSDSMRWGSSASVGSGSPVSGSPIGDESALAMKIAGCPLTAPTAGVPIMPPNANPGFRWPDCAGWLVHGRVPVTRSNA